MRPDRIGLFGGLFDPIYLQNLKDDFILPRQEEGISHAFHIFNVRHPRRDMLREFLKKEGVGTEIHYPVPPHRQEALRDMFPDGRFPISEEIHGTTLSLPISFGHSVEQISRVVEIMNGF